MLAKSVLPGFSGAIEDLADGLPQSPLAKAITSISSEVLSASEALGKGQITATEFGEILQKRGGPALISWFNSLDAATVEALRNREGFSELLDSMYQVNSFVNSTFDPAAAAAEQKRQEKLTNGMATLDNKIRNAVSTIQIALIDSGVFELAGQAVEVFANTITNPSMIAFLKKSVEEFSTFLSNFVKDVKNIGVAGAFIQLLENVFTSNTAATIGSFMFDSFVKLVNSVFSIDTAKLIGNAILAMWDSSPIVTAIVVGLGGVFAAIKLKNLLSFGVDDRGTVGRGLGAGASGLGRGLGAGIAGLGKGIGVGTGAILSGIAKGIGSFTAATPGLIPFAAAMGIVTASIIGLGTALRIAGPALEPFGNMIKSVLEGVKPALEGFAEVLTSVFTGISGVITSIGNVITGTITSVSDGIGYVIEKITEYKTAGIEATTDQIERLSAIPGTNLEAAARGLEQMKVALEGFQPGFFDSLGAFFTGGAASEQMTATTSNIENLAAAFSRMNPDQITSASTAVKLMGESLVSFATGLAANTGQSFIESIASWFGGGEQESVIDKVINMSAAFSKLNGEAIVAGAEGVSAIANSIKQFTSAKVEDFKFNSDLISQIESISSKSSKLSVTAQNLESISRLQGLGSNIQSFTTSLDFSTVDNYASSIENLAEQLEYLNEVLAESNDAWTSERMSAGELLQDVGETNRTTADKIETLNTTLLAILTTLRENNAIDSNIERNTRVAGMNLGRGIITR